MPHFGEGGYGEGKYGYFTAVPPDPSDIPEPDPGEPPVVIPPPSISATGVIAAIIARWNQELSTYFNDPRLWFGRVPAQPTTPYAALIQVSDPVFARTTASAFFDGVYQINVIADDLAEAVSLADLVWDEFDRAELSADGSILHCLSGEIRTTLGEQLGLGGSDAWVAYVELEILSMR